jgi:Glycosyl transferases group 1
MRLFQNFGLIPAYRARHAQRLAGLSSFAAQIDSLVDDRFCAVHILKPVLDRAPEAFFSSGDDELTQRQWAAENGLKPDATLEDILLAQIEHHRTEVFYNLDPVRYPSAFVRRLPGSVRKSIAWRAALSGSADFSAYDLVVCNFPSLLADYKRLGWKTAWFFPGHDPAMDAYAERRDRPVDIAFVGSYTRVHRRRAALIEAIAGLSDRYRVALHLDANSRFLRLAESPLGLVGPLAKYRRPGPVRRIAQPPIFGRDLYDCMGAARIVINGAADLGGLDRGNMRCWEAMGPGALLLTDEGNYPEGMVNGETMVTYRSAEDAVAQIERLLAPGSPAEAISLAGHQFMRRRYSKERQWADFMDLCA